MTPAAAHKCHVDLTLESPVFLDRLEFTNSGTCFVTLMAGPNADLQAQVLPRTPTNSMLRHKAEAHRKDAHTFLLAVTDTPCAVARLVLEQPYEPEICIGVTRLVLYGCDIPPRPSTITPSPVDQVRKLHMVSVKAPLAVPLAELSDEDEADDATSAAPLSIQGLRDILVRRHSQHEEYQKQLEKTAIGYHADAAAAKAEVKGAASMGACTSVTECGALGRADKGLGSNTFKPPAPVPPSPAASPPSAAPCGPGCLKGVTFVLSGFQNPERGQLRDMALEMGATYAGDWGPGATHLIAAFANTPKVKDVMRAGHGHIVTREWLKQCHALKRRMAEGDFGHGPDAKRPKYS